MTSRLSFLRRLRPAISFVVVAYDMKREIARTLRSLDSSYQDDICPRDYEVIVVDNGSPEPLDFSYLRSYFSGSLRLYRLPKVSASPVAAVNHGVEMARASRVAVRVDGARMLSPGVVRGFLNAFRIFYSPFVYTLGWHLGDQPQNISMTQGYNQTVEDRLLDSFDWLGNGYLLFRYSCLALSSRKGWFSSISESNCFAMRRRDFQSLGGFDSRFQLPGGGLVNLDFFRRAVTSPMLQPALLLGEGSFHQFHGGVATNVIRENHPFERFQEEYRSIRGSLYESAEFSPFYLGSLSEHARRFL